MDNHDDELLPGLGAGHGGHGGHLGPTSRREFIHNGKTVEIVTHYTITIDGKRLDTHISIGDDGQATCHAMPYRTFRSLNDLIKSLLDLYSDEFQD